MNNESHSYWASDISQLCTQGNAAIVGEAPSVAPQYFTSAATDEVTLNKPFPAAKFEYMSLLLVPRGRKGGLLLYVCVCGCFGFLLSFSFTYLFINLRLHSLYYVSFPVYVCLPVILSVLVTCISLP